MSINGQRDSYNVFYSFYNALKYFHVALQVFVLLSLLWLFLHQWLTYWCTTLVITIHALSRMDQNSSCVLAHTHRKLHSSQHFPVVVRVASLLSGEHIISNIDWYVVVSLNVNKYNKYNTYSLKLSCPFLTKNATIIIEI